MKKYKRCVVLIIAVFGVIGVIVYRSQYLQLRQTMEALYIYSSGNDKVDCLTLNDSVVKDDYNSNLFSPPEPFWSFTGTHHVYSGFWERTHEKATAKVLAVGNVESPVEYKCHVWYDFHDSLFSLDGEFSFSVVLRNGSLAIFEFLCGFKIPNFNGGLPHVVVLIPEPAHRKIYVPVFTHSHNVFNTSALCVLPDKVGESKNDVVEFLSFAAALNVGHVLAYDPGTQLGLLNRLKHLNDVPGVLPFLTTLNWNFPFVNDLIEKKLIELDCIYRTSGQAALVGIVTWDTYIIPLKGDSFNIFLNDFSNKATVHYRLPTQICCLNSHASRSSWPTILNRTKCLPPSSFTDIISYPQLHLYEKEVNLDKMSGTVHVLRDCNQSSLRTATHTSSSLKYISHLMNSKLLKIWRSGVLFTP